jgi:peptidoglycan/LPS O-acetylase OafA/YrhL
VKGRSAVALLAGLIVGAGLSLGTDQVLHLLQVYPPWGRPMTGSLFLLATAYRTVYGVLGSYIAARLAPDRAMGHALVLGALGGVVSLVGAVATWNKGPEFGPHWYPLALVLLAMPCAWLGGALNRNRQATSS